MVLCRPCDHFATSVLHQDFSTWTFHDYNDINAGLVLPLMNKANLVKHDTRNCEFCRIFGTLNIPENEGGVEDQDLKLQISFTTAKAQWSDPKYVFNLVFVNSEGVEDYASSQFQLFAGSSQEVSNDYLARCLMQMPQQIASHSYSQDCLEVARSWIHECLTKHDKCNRQADTVLPTRLIDVGTPDGSTEPKLVVTNRATQRYITLSYCWGDSSNTVTTTRDNFELHCSTIELRSLPKTLRDAIMVTRALGCRYIWIDALCITQDDPEDWKREASNMCSIYEHGDFCIGALESTSSDGGLHGRRLNEQIFVQTGGVRIGIRELPSTPQHHVPDTPLECRAWTFQERVLTPAMLYFGAGQLFWECCSGMASESSPNIRESPQGENDSYFGGSVHEFKLILQGTSSPHDNIIWYQAVEKYTTRALTHLTDRLPALQGLATKFQSRIGGEYVFGLWLNDMHKGLLWGLFTDSRNNQYVIWSASMPSWSWMSHNASISHRNLAATSAGHHVEPKATFEYFETATSPVMAPSTTKHVLEISAPFVHGACMRVFKRERACNMISHGSTSFFDYVSCELDALSDDVRPEAFVPIEYTCLLIAEQRLSDDLVENLYLLLEPTDVKLEEHSEVCYRRAGVGWSTVGADVPSDVFADAVSGTFLVI